MLLAICESNVKKSLTSPAYVRLWWWSLLGCFKGVQSWPICVPSFQIVQKCLTMFLWLCNLFQQLSLIEERISFPLWLILIRLKPRFREKGVLCPWIFHIYANRVRLLHPGNSHSRILAGFSLSLWSILGGMILYTVLGWIQMQRTEI